MCCAGMICPHIVNVSMMLGAIVSWGALWPILATKAGDWYPAGLNEHDFTGLFGYKASTLFTMLFTFWSFDCMFHSAGTMRGDKY